MPILRFRRMSLEDWNLLEVKDPDTKYIVYNEDESIYGEFIGSAVIGTRPDNVTIVLNDEDELSIKDNLEIDGGFL